MNNNVFTIIGEHGNHSGPYTQELLTLDAALAAIAASDFPLLRLGSGQWEKQGSQIVATTSEAHWYSIVEHPPRVKVDEFTYRGGVHNGVRVYDRDGTVGPYGSAKRTMDEDVPAAWINYRRNIAATE